MSENITQCGGLFENIDNEIVQGFGAYLCQLEITVKDFFTQNGMDGFHVLFLLSLILIVLVIGQSYITKGQGSIMSWGFWILAIFVILMLTGVL